MELPNIFTLLSKDSSRYSVGIGFLYENNVEKYSLVIVGICTILFVVIYLIASDRGYSIFPVLIALIALIVYISSSAITSIFRNPSQDFLSDLSERSKDQMILMQKLSVYSHEDLLLAYNRIEYEIEKLNSRLGFLVGALEKLGIIPAVIALYLSLSKALGSNQFSGLPIYVFAFVFGLYIGAVVISRVIGSYRYYYMVLGASLQGAEDTKKIKSALTKQST